MNSEQTKVFFEIHKDLPREAPGSDQSTLIAFSLVPDLPAIPRILDIGCGPGTQTLCLASACQGQIVAVDTHRAFLDQLKQKATEKGFADRVTPLEADMCLLDLPKESIDLIWAEGSLYIVGIETGLRKFRNFLSDKGTIAFTEATWLRSDAPPEARDYWQTAYPSMVSTEENVAMIERSGYRLIAEFELSPEEWTADYYLPIEEKIPRMKQEYRENPLALKVIAEHEREIEIFEKYSSYYGYVFYIAQKREAE